MSSSSMTTTWRVANVENSYILGFHTLLNVSIQKYILYVLISGKKYLCCNESIKDRFLIMLNLPVAMDVLVLKQMCGCRCRAKEQQGGSRQTVYEQKPGLGLWKAAGVWLVWSRLSSLISISALHSPVSGVTFLLSPSLYSLLSFHSSTANNSND